MKITTVMQNVQGLNDPLKVEVVRHYFRPLFRGLEVLCFQEHHLRGAKLDALKYSFWPQASFFGCEAAVGFGHVQGDAGVGTGGVCMWIASHIAHLVTAFGHTQCGRAQWVRLSGLPGGDISILNIYASTSARIRCALWEELLVSLPRDCRWSMRGDWNFVERQVDKSNLNGRIITVGECRVFTLLKDALEVSDQFPDTGRLKFYWDNMRRLGLRSLARLDRCYSFQQLGAGPSPVVEYYIRGDCNHADHLPICHTVQLLPPVPKKSFYKMSSYYLKDPVVKAAVERIWAQNHRLEFTGKLRRVIKFYKHFCTRKASERRAAEAALRSQLDALHIALQSDPHNPELYGQIREVGDLLAAFEKHVIEGQRVRSRVKWKIVGDSCSKEFFRASKAHSFILGLPTLPNLKMSLEGFALIMRDLKACAQGIMGGCTLSLSSRRSRPQRLPRLFPASVTGSQVPCNPAFENRLVCMSWMLP